MADGRALRWAGQREMRRADFVEAALTVIERDGPGATVDAIAAERGVTRQALYRQFQDRADLDRAIAERAGADLMAHLLPALDLRDDVDASIRVGLNAYVDFVTSHLSLYRFVRMHEADADVVASVKTTVAGRIAAIARDYLLETGFAPADIAETFALGAVGMSDAVLAGWLDDPRGLSREQVVDQLVLMVSGVVRVVAS